MTDQAFATGAAVALRRISPADLAAVSGFPFTVSITEPLEGLAEVTAAFEVCGLWGEEAGACAIVEAAGPGSAGGRLLGTAQFYRAAPCIHGLELGYILHDQADRGRGYGAQAVKLFSDHLFSARPGVYRQQLVIEAWNTASWKLAERCGFVREGLMRSAGFGSGDPADCFLYARTRKDWHEASHSPVSMGGMRVGG
jgi:RimJ/RimL family protein N-acetyltransferase